MAEVHIVTDGVIKLSETANSITIAGFTKTTDSPTAGQFKPLYFYDAYAREVAGILQFNVADEGASVSVAYNGLGSIIWADDYNTVRTDLGLKANATQVLTNVPAGALFTDTVTTVENVLTSTSTTNALSANQGYVLNNLVNTKPPMTTANLTYYVATTGSDSNNGLAVGTPFLTIAKAISMIPQIVNHAVIVNLAVGTYNENILINGVFGNSAIAIQGATDLANSVNYKVDSLSINNCFANISVIGINFITTTSPGIYCGCSTYCWIRFCTIDGAAAFDGLKAAKGSATQIRECSISNKNQAITADEQARVFSYLNSGTGNTTVFMAAKAGEIVKSGVQPTGTTAESAITGGLIR